MAEYDGAGNFGIPEEDDDDDIARFERQCMERARAAGLPTMREEEEADDDDAASDEEPATSSAAAAAAPVSSAPSGGAATDAWQRKFQLLQEKLARREAELAQARGDLEMLKAPAAGAGDAGSELKQRLLDLTKKNRRLQVSAETQKARIQQLEAELKQPREQARKQAEELAAQTTAGLLGDGAEDWKKKCLQNANKLQEVRQEAQELRIQGQRQRKVLLKELGSDEVLDRALTTADDPNASEWRGRAAQVSQLQRQVKELREQLKKAGPATEDAEEGEADSPQRPRRARGETAADRERAALAQAADRRREELERLQEETERLRAEQAESKRKREALKSRTSVLESQLREMKAHVQALLSKSDNDTALVAALRRQLGRSGEEDVEALHGAGAEEAEALRLQVAELQEQVERQAQTLLQQRQKSFASLCDSGSLKLGPGAGGAPSSAITERVRFLEAENMRQAEHVRLLRGRLGDDTESGPGRPFSAESSLNLKDRLRQMGEQLAACRRENLTLRQQQAMDPLSRPASGVVVDPLSRPASGAASGRSSSAGGRVHH